MSVMLRKFLTQDIEPIIRSAFAEDDDLLRTYNPAINKGLDLATNDFLSVMFPTDVFFRLENQYGAFAGFVTMSKTPEEMSFHLRNSFRTPEYTAAFWNLINETLNNNFFTSTGSSNLTSIPEILKTTFKIKNQQEYHAKNFILLKIDL